MNCARIQAELIALEQGELTASARDTVRAHLEACAACRAERELLRAVWRAARAIPRLEPSPGFRCRLWERLGPFRSRG